MASLSSRTGLTPVDTTIALANNTATTIQSFAAYDAQELIGHVFVDATTDYRAAVKVTVVKNGAGTYEVAASDVAGDDISGSPIVTFAMSGSNLQATLPNFTGFASASIKYHLVSPVTNANYPLSIDGGQILSGTVAAARLPEAGASNAGIITTGAQTIAGAKTFSSGILAPSLSVNASTAITAGTPFNVVSGMSVGGIMRFNCSLPASGTWYSVLEMSGSNECVFMLFVKLGSADRTGIPGGIAIYSRGGAGATNNNLYNVSGWSTSRMQLSGSALQFNSAYSTYGLALSITAHRIA
jgi:hypothetical protein